MAGLYIFFVRRFSNGYDHMDYRCSVVFYKGAFIGKNDIMGHKIIEVQYVDGCSITFEVIGNLYSNSKS